MALSFATPSGHSEGMATTAVRFKFGKSFKDNDSTPAAFQTGVSRVFDLKQNSV